MGVGETACVVPEGQSQCCPLGRVALHAWAASFHAQEVLAALAISRWISSGSPLLGSCTRHSASCVHLGTQMPQPMQRAESTLATPSLVESAPNWQKSLHMPQPVQRLTSTWLTYPEEANIGVPCLQACIAPQQHAQQLQIA